MFATDGIARSFDEKAFYERHRQEASAYIDICRYYNIDPSGQFMLDVGGGYGDHLPWLANFSEETYVADIIKYTSDTGFDPKTIKEAGQKYGGDFDLTRVQFHTADAQNLFYRDNYFDVIVSINAFEHIPNPILAFSEILRVAKPGAKIFIQFDPIWQSPFGHHLWHLNFDPWQHLLVEEKEFTNMIYARGGNSTDEEIYRNHMNRLPYSYYSELLTKFFVERCSVVHYNKWAKDYSEEEHVRHSNFKICLERGFKESDILVRGVQFLGIRA